MRISELPPEVIAEIRLWRYDRILEKHEGPFDWGAVLDYYDPEFLDIGGRPVLLPIGKDQHPAISILRLVPSEDGRMLTIFLKDRTHLHDPADEMFCAGFLAVCEKFPGQEFFLATVYHEWFIVENQPST